MMKMEISSNTREGQKQKKPRKVTEKYLANAALYYLERYAATEEMLRQVLKRRVYASVRHHHTDRDEGLGMVEKLIIRYREAGLLNDAQWAQAKARTLWEKGTARRMIELKLKQKGLAQLHIIAAIESLKDENTDPEKAAAWYYARKKKLGPYRLDARDENREKDMAKLARAGFGYDLVRDIIETEEPPE